MSWRVLQRVGAVLALLLALVVLGADAGEYPALSRAGLRAFARGVLPLLAVAALNLAALDRQKAVRLLSLVANVVFLAAVLAAVRGNAPPLVWMSLLVAALLVMSSAMRVAGGAVRPPGPVDRDARGD